jgi:hypothetical protein
MAARDIPGWNSDITPWAEWIAPRIPQGGTYLEVGVFLGASLATMGELRPDITLIAVDPWEAPAAPGWIGVEESIFKGHVAEHGDLFLAFLANMMKHAPDTLRRTRVIRGTARNVGLSTPVDMLFVDGAHSYEAVLDDLRAFAPQTRGIVSGHDYDNPEVAQAVDEYFGHQPHRGKPDGTSPACWWVST